MADRLELPTMNKFNGKHFQTWKFQMNMVFAAHGLVGIVDGTIPKPVVGKNNATADDVKDWEKANGKAMMLISTAMEYSVLTLLTTSTTAKQMIDKLNEVYAQTDESNKLIVQQQYYAAKLERNENVATYVSRIEALAAQLKELQLPQADTSVIAKVIGGLPDKYASFVTAWESVPTTSQTLAILTSRLVREESRMSSRDAYGAALTVQAKPHFRSNSSNRFKNVKCFNCNRKGHISRNCKAGRKEHEHPPNPKDRNADNRNHGNGSSSLFMASAMLHDKPTPTEGWCADSGASAHMTFEKHWFSDYRSLANHPTVHLGDDTELNVNGIGSIHILALVNGKWESGIMQDVLHVPDLRHSLFSMSAYTAKGNLVTIEENKCVFSDRDRIRAIGIRQGNGLYKMLIKVVEPLQANVVKADSLKIWHERLGHINYRSLKDMVKDGLITGVTDMTEPFCEACQFGKLHRVSFKTVTDRVEYKVGECIHSDVCGPMTKTSYGGSDYFVLFKDDVSGYRQVYFIKHKSDVFERFVEFAALVRNKFGYGIKILHTDGGGEYRSNQFKSFLASMGIEHEVSSPHTPQQNGRAERDMRTLVESARAMLFANNLPTELWSEAVNTAVYIRNRTPSTQAPETPFKMWTGKRASLTHIRKFGCFAYEHVSDDLRKKWEYKAKKHILIGYDGHSNNYRLFDPETKRISVSPSVVFNETDFVVRNKESSILKLSVPIDNEIITEPESEDSSDSDTVNDGDDDNDDEEDEYASDDTIISGGHEDNARPDDLFEEEELEQPTTEDSRVEGRLRPKSKLKIPSKFWCNFTSLDEPYTYDEAVTSNDKNKWEQAMREELDALEKNKTWQLVARPTGRKVIGCKWVYKIKRTPDGAPERYKARLCAKGFSQREGIDFNETFSPVVRYDSVRVLLALAAQNDYEISQFDIKTAFLHGELEEEIYMDLPEGMSGSQVCKLNKSLYGLKQAPRCWNKKFNDFLLTFNFTQSNADKCVYVGDVNGSKVILALYVDDGLLLSQSKKAINILLKQMQLKFDVTIGNASYYVGMQIKRDRANKSIFVNQSAYLKKVIDKFGMTDAKGLKIPADPNIHLAKTESASADEKIPFRELVGSLMFAACVSRPDIAYAVNMVSKYLSNYTNEHWLAAKRILRYIRDTMDYGILYDGLNTQQLIGYSDSDFAGDVDSRRSTSGYLYVLAGGPVTWTSQRQRIVALSTTEAEYIAASQATKEAIWLRRLLMDLGFGCDGPTELSVDNQGAIKLTKNDEFHKRTKHIDVRYHFVREKVAHNEIGISYVPSKENLSDILTKALPRDYFARLRSQLNVVKL